MDRYFLIESVFKVVEPCEKIIDIYVEEDNNFIIESTSILRKTTMGNISRILKGYAVNFRISGEPCFLQQ